MPTNKPVERRAFLATTAAVVAHITSCTDETRNGGPEPPPSSDASASDAASPETEHSETTEISTSGPSSSHGAPSSESTSSLSPSSSSTAESSSTDSTVLETTRSSETRGSEANSSSGAPPLEDTCQEGLDTDGGLGEGSGSLCSTNTSNDDHCHPLAIPTSDAEAGLGGATYVLEDGGTGHTHTVTLTAYDLFYLQAGVTVQVESSTADGHSHTCRVSCSD